MKTHRSTIALISFCFLILLGSCNKEDESNPVAPTNKFVGKWKTEIPILVNVKTDFCTGTLEDVATMEWDIYWVVSSTDNPNVMDIKMNYSSRDYIITNPECNTGTGYVPEPQPIYLTGYVTDNTLSVEYLGEEIFFMNYVENKVMRGGLSYSYCLVYCQELYTEDDFSITYY